MRTIEIYEAEDGTRFEDYDECLQYEARKYSTGGVKYYDKNMYELTPDEDGWEEVGNRAEFICILDAEGAKKEFKYIIEMYGYEYPENPESREAYAYDERKAEWYKITDRIEKYAKMNRELWEEALREE